MSEQALEVKVRLAAQEFLRGMRDVSTQFDAAMRAVSGDGAQAATALDAAFRVLGVKGVKQLEAEVTKLRAALDEVRKSDALPQDKAAAVDAYTKRVAELRGQLQPTSARAREMGASAEAMSAALGNAAHKALMWTAAIAGFSSLGDLGKQIIATGSEFQNLQVRLENLLGSTQKADAAFTMLKDLAASTPFEVTALTESFVKLSAFGMQPTEAQMRSLSDVAANLGGGTETLSRVTLALGQAWTKSKLQGQEIMQLAEAGVPVWDALSRATGRTVPELSRMSEAGMLGRDVIGSLIDELGRMNAGASDKLMNTYAGAVSNAKDALAEFFDMISKSGVLDYLTSKIQEMLAEFDRMKESGELEAKARAIADTFLNIATAAEGIITVLLDLSPILIKVAELWEGAAAAAGLRGALFGVAAQSVPTAAGMGSVGVQSAVAAGSMGTASVAGRALLTVLRGIRMLTGVGLVMAAGEMAMEFFRAKREAEEADRAVEMLMRPPPVNGPSDAAKSAGAAMGQMATGAQKAGNEMLAQLDQATQKGKSTAEAMAEIGKSLDVSSAKGVAAATTAFSQMQQSGKASAKDVQAAWSEALKGEDLLLFETRAKTAFRSGELSATQLQQALDAGLRESVRRSGQDFSVISGGMSEASKTAINDTQVLIEGLDSLKSQGVDTGLALSASIKKSINAADSQPAIDAIKSQIGSLRDKLGDKITDGLLQQVAEQAGKLSDKLDDATAGINSAREAMRALGVTTDESLQASAKKSAEAFEVLRESGTASARELAQGWKRMAEDAIKANKGTANAVIQSQAAVHGYTIEVDKAGQATVKAASEASAGTETIGAGWDRVADKTRQATGEVRRYNDAVRRGSTGEEMADGVTEVGSTGQYRNRAGMSSDAKGGAVVMGSELRTKTGVFNFLKSAGVDDEEAARKITEQAFGADGQFIYMDNPLQKKHGRNGHLSFSMALLKEAEEYTFGGGKQRKAAAQKYAAAECAASTPASALAAPAHQAAPATRPSERSVRVNLNLAGRELGDIKTDEAGAANIERFVRSLEESMRQTGKRATL